MRNRRSHRSRVSGTHVAAREASEHAAIPAQGHVFFQHAVGARGRRAESAQLRPLYACRPLKNMFTMVKLNSTAAKPMIDSQADREPRQPRVARAWMYPA